MKYRNLEKIIKLQMVLYSKISNFKQYLKK